MKKVILSDDRKRNRKNPIILSSLTDEESEILSHHESLIWQVLNKYLPHSSDSTLDDVYGEAALGLIEAFQKYNPDKGSFSTIAYFKIRGRLSRHCHWFSFFPKHFSSYDNNEYETSVKDVQKNHFNWDDMEVFFEKAELTLLEKDMLFQYYKNGLDTTDIYNSSNVTKQAISSRICQARKKLKKLFDNQNITLLDLL